MHVVAAGADLGVDHSTLEPPELGVIGARLHAKFPKGIRRRLHDLRAALLRVGRERVVVHAVQREVILEREVPVHVDLRLARIAAAWRRHSPRSEQDQIRVSPPIERQIHDPSLLDNSPHIGALRLQNRDRLGDDQLLRDHPRLQGHVHAQALLDMQDDIAADGRLKAGRRDANLIWPGLQGRSDVRTGRIRRDLHARPPFQMDDRHLRVRDHGPGRIGDRPEDDPRVDLRARPPRQSHEQQDDERASDVSPCGTVSRHNPSSSAFSRAVWRGTGGRSVTVGRPPVDASKGRSVRASSPLHTAREPDVRNPSRRPRLRAHPTTIRSSARALPCPLRRR
ncbi:hypothetical protein HRbin08_02267 [bacterium HR08]|nr:hypothetical protein HRbin08_02267 [bacterium HR08]